MNTLSIMSNIEGEGNFWRVEKLS